MCRYQCPPGEGQGEGSAGYDLTTAGNVLWALTDHENTIRDLVTYNAGTDTTTVANHRVFDSYAEPSLSWWNSSAWENRCRRHRKRLRPKESNGGRSR
jgi:hypothetical protein